MITQKLGLFRPSLTRAALSTLVTKVQYSDIYKTQFDIYTKKLDWFGRTLQKPVIFDSSEDTILNVDGKSMEITSIRNNKYKRIKVVKNIK